MKIVEGRDGSVSVTVESEPLAPLPLQVDCDNLRHELENVRVDLRCKTTALKDYANVESKLQDWANLHRKATAERDELLAALNGVCSAWKKYLLPHWNGDESTLPVPDEVTAARALIARIEGGKKSCNLHADCAEADASVRGFSDRSGALHCSDPECMMGDCAKVNGETRGRKVTEPGKAVIGPSGMVGIVLMPGQMGGGTGEGFFFDGGFAMACGDVYVRPVTDVVKGREAVVLPGGDLAMRQPGELPDGAILIQDCRWGSTAKAGELALLECGFKMRAAMEDRARALAAREGADQ